MKLKLLIPLVSAFVLTPIYRFNNLKGPLINLPDADLRENTKLAAYIGHQLGIHPERIKTLNSDAKLIDKAEQALDGRVTFVINSCEKALLDKIDEPKSEFPAFYRTFKDEDGLTPMFKSCILFHFLQYSTDKNDETILQYAAEFSFQKLSGDDSCNNPLDKIKPEKKSSLMLWLTDIYCELDNLIKHGEPYDISFSEWLDQNRAIYLRSQIYSMGVAQIDLGNGLIIKIPKIPWSDLRSLKIVTDDSVKSESFGHIGVNIYKNNINIMNLRTYNEMKFLRFVSQISSRIVSLFPDDVFIDEGK